MSSTSADAKKRCKNCLQYVEIYITCFKCDAVYHIYCWKKVPEAYVNQRGQLFCCRGLTSNCAATNENLGTQDSPLEKVIKKENLDSSKEDFENCLIKEEDSEWNEFKCDACLLKFTTKDQLINHYSKCPNKEGRFVQELKEDKDLDNCLHKEEDLEWNEFQCDACLLEFTNKEHLENHCNNCPNKEGESNQELNEDKAGFFCSLRNKENFQKEFNEQHLKQCHVESSYSRLNMDNNIYKIEPAHVDDKEKKYECTVGNYSTHVVKRMRIHNNDNSFKCSTQAYRANESEILKSYFSPKHYDGEEKYNCWISADSTPSENDFESHRQVHASEKPFKCDRCDYGAAEKINLKIHIISKHSNEPKKYKCRNCEYSTNRKGNLVSHTHTHTNEKPFKCDMCDYATARKEVLKRHALAKHSNTDKEYKCRYCEYSAHSKGNLVTHIRTHANEKPFKCDMCDYAAVRKSHLKTHILVKHSNTDKDYKCKDCEYSTYRKQDLGKHIRTHTNAKPFKCDVCDYAAAGQSNLKNHVIVKHSNAEKMYKCRDCDYSTFRKQDLVKHIRTHTNEKPFKCGVCDYAAAGQSNLKNHVIAKHSNAEKKYKCRVCEYSTFRKQDLVKHICIHTNEKPFKCDVCDYAAVRKSNLKKHVIVKHSNAEKMYKCRD